MFFVVAFSCCLCNFINVRCRFCFIWEPIENYVRLCCCCCCCWYSMRIWSAMISLESKASLLTRLDVAVDVDVEFCVAPKYICSVLCRGGCVVCVWCHSFDSYKRRNVIRNLIFGFCVAADTQASSACQTVASSALTTCPTNFALTPHNELLLILALKLQAQTKTRTHSHIHSHVVTLEHL